MLKVTDRFTTRDGQWELGTGKEYAISKEALQKYGNDNIPGMGASTHIFVKVPKDAYVVEFNTSDGKNKNEVHDRGGEWISFPLFHTSSYDPKNSAGPWLVRVDGELVAEGIGLPYSWHVSTFLVVEDVEPVVQPPPAVEGKDKVQLFINGVLAWSN